MGPWHKNYINIQHSWALGTHVSAFLFLGKKIFPPFMFGVVNNCPLYLWNQPISHSMSGNEQIPQIHYFLSYIQWNLFKKWPVIRHKEDKKLRIAFSFPWTAFLIIVIPLDLTEKVWLEVFAHFPNIEGEIGWF